MKLIGEVGERLVRFGHFVDVLALGKGGSLLIVSVEQLGGELLRRRLAFLVAHRGEDPADTQSLGAIGLYRHRDLVAGAADALGTNFDLRFDVVKRLKEGIERLNIGDLLFENVESVIEDSFGRCLFAIEHQVIDELAGDKIPVAGVALELLSTCGDLSHLLFFLN